MAHPAHRGALGDRGTTAAAWLAPVAGGGGGGFRAAAAASGISCELSAEGPAAAASYALLAMAGVAAGGWYVARCAVVFCPGGRGLEACSAFGADPLPSGGAVFASLSLHLAAAGTNVAFHSALCEGYEVLRPRSAAQLAEDRAGGRTLTLSGAACPLAVAFVDARAQSEDEAPECPAGKCGGPSPGLPLARSPLRAGNHGRQAAAAGLVVLA